MNAEYRGHGHIILTQALCFRHPFVATSTTEPRYDARQSSAGSRSSCSAFRARADYCSYPTTSAVLALGSSRCATPKVRMASSLTPTWSRYFLTRPPLTRHFGRSLDWSNRAGHRAVRASGAEQRLELSAGSAGVSAYAKLSRPFGSGIGRPRSVAVAIHSRIATSTASTAAR